MDTKNQNVIVLMGRGIEGTGNTRFTIELNNRIRKAGNSSQIIANNEKKWGRNQSQVNDIIERNFKKGEFTAPKDVDICIITSVPAKNYSDEGKRQFLDIMKALHENGTKVIYIQVDHKIHSISRNMYRDETLMEEFFSYIDLIVTHDLRNDFNQKFVKRFHIENDVIERLCIGADMDEFKLLRKPASEKLDKTIYFIGRSAGWKGWMVLRDLQYRLLKQKGYASVIEGIELSIGVLGELYSQTKPERIAREDVILKLGKEYSNTQLDELENNKGQSAFIYPPYVRNDAIDRISKCKFGFFGTYMGTQFGGPLENTMLEYVNAGTMLIIRKELYDCASFNGVQMNEFTATEMGLIIYDAENEEQFLKELEFYDTNDSAYDDAVERSIKFFKKHFDNDVLITNIWESIAKFF